MLFTNKFAGTENILEKTSFVCLHNQFY